MSIECRVIDAGARYGLHPSWESFIGIAEFHLFEPDAEESNRLKNKYTEYSNIAVHSKALYSESKTLTFRVSRHRALNSILPANTDFLEKESYKLSEFDTMGTFEVEAVSIDEYYEKTPIHFLKLDTEGSELDILNGAKKKLSTTILGVRIETLFTEIYEGCPLFGDIHQFMLSQGFELLNLDYDGKGAALSPFASPDRFGRLMSTDGVWIRPFSDIYESSRFNVREDVIRLASFLMNNNAADVALRLLIDSVDLHELDFSIYNDDIFYKNLRYKIATHFKNLTYIPSVDCENLYSTYLKIFKQEFPRLNDFYETSW